MTPAEMRPATKLGAFGLALAAAVAAGFALGTAVGPVDVGGGPDDTPVHVSDH